MMYAQPRAMLVLAVALSVGCTADGGRPANGGVRDTSGVDPRPAQAQVPDTGATPADAAAEPPVGDASDWTARDTRVERALAGVAILRRVETGRHEGFDRVVFDFGDDSIPSYRVSYIDRPVRQCGSGNVVTLPGDAWLEVHFEPAHAHTDEGRPTIEERHRRTGLPTILELVLTCDFEAHVTWVAAVPSPERYRVLELHQPHRLVVDVRHRATR